MSNQLRILSTASEAEDGKLKMQDVAGLGSAVLRNPHLYGLAPVAPNVEFKNVEQFTKCYSQNTGNLAFVHACWLIFGTSVNAHPWTSTLRQFDAEKDVMVFPAANQIGAHVDMGRVVPAMTKSHIPILMIGLGSQFQLEKMEPDAVPQGTIEWLEHIASRAPVKDIPNISLRGHTSMLVLKHFGLDKHAVVTGCPSNFICAHPSLGVTISRKIRAHKKQKRPRVAVAAGSPSRPELLGLEQSLIEMLLSTRGEYIVQHPPNMIAAARQIYGGNMRPAIEAQCSKVLPERLRTGTLRWFARNARVYSFVPEWMAGLRTFDYVVGTRIHGTMLGLQAGVPSVCLYVDSRTKELCETMGIPSANAKDFQNGITVSDVRSILDDWNSELYDRTRVQLGRMLQELIKGNNVRTSRHLTNILGSE
ncbi:MAG: polysaccharide pyruvyl transferase family protein [Hyphomicrobium sp.]